MMGDGRTYECVVVLWAVQTFDFMTSGWAPLPHPLLVRKPSRIIIQLAFHQLDTAASSPTIRLALRLVLVDTLVKQSVEITRLSDRTCPYNGKHPMKSIGCSVPSTATDAVR